VESLDEKIRILERKLELKDEDDDKKKSENATVTAGKDGFSIVSADKESVLKFKFFQHIDGRAFFEDADNKLPNTSLVRPQCVPRTPRTTICLGSLLSASSKTRDRRYAGRI